MTFSKTYNRTKSPLGQLVGRLEAATEQTSGVDPALVGRLVAMESLDDQSVVALADTARGLEVAIESAARGDEGCREYGPEQLRAGSVAMLMASAPVESMVDPAKRRVSLESMGDYDGVASAPRVLATETYNERDIRSMAAYSAAFNMEASTQDEFAEAFFPVTTITPDQAGLSVNMQLVQAYPAFERKLGVTPDNFGRIPVNRALVDPSVLDRSHTTIVPIVKPTTVSKFVDASLVVPEDVNVGGEVLKTAPLKMGATIDLIDISATPELLRAGTLDSTDTVDAAATLTKLYASLKIGAAPAVAVSFGGLDLIGSSNFLPSAEGVSTRMTLTHNTRTIIVGPNTKTNDGFDIPGLDPLRLDSGYLAHFAADVYGTLVLDTAAISVHGSTLRLIKVTNTSWGDMDITTGVGKQIADLFTGFELVGYDVQARRSNANRRQAGQLVDITGVSQVYEIPLLSPISTPRSVSSADLRDAGDLSALVAAARVGCSVAAVDKLVSTAESMAPLLEIGDIPWRADPEIGGVSRLLVKPYYHEEILDISTVLPNEQQYVRDAAIQEFLVNNLRTRVFEAYADSGYRSAQTALYGNRVRQPIVVVGTSPKLARYLQISGDLRTIGGGFDDVRIVQSTDPRMAMAIYVVLQSPADYGDASPLSFGTTAWRPELVSSRTIYSDTGSTSRQLLVQPSYRHVVKTTVMIKFNVVEGLSLR